MCCAQAPRFGVGSPCPVCRAAKRGGCGSKRSPAACLGRRAAAAAETPAQPDQRPRAAKPRAQPPQLAGSASEATPSGNDRGAAQGQGTIAVHAWPRRNPTGVAAQLAALAQRPQGGSAQPAPAAEPARRGGKGRAPAQGKPGVGQRAAGNDSSRASGEEAAAGGRGGRQRLHRLRRAGEAPAASRGQPAGGAEDPYAFPAPLRDPSAAGGAGDPDEAGEAAEVLASLSDGEAPALPRGLSMEPD